MNRLLPLSLLLAAFAAGCQATNPQPAATSQPAIPAETGNNEITIYINSAGDMWVGKWKVDDKNLPDLVRERQVGKAKIVGQGEYKRALEIKKELQAAGVKKIEIDG